jgi:hypothetical protein
LTSHAYFNVDGATAALEILAFVRAAQQAPGFSGARSLRAIEKTVVCKDGGRRKVTVLFIRNGPERPLEWLINTFNAREQRLLAAQVVHRAVPTLQPKDSGWVTQQVLRAHLRMQRFSHGGPALPTRLSIVSAGAILNPLASRAREQKQALINLRKRTMVRLSSRGHISRGIAGLAAPHGQCDWLLRLPRFLLDKHGRNRNAQIAILTAFEPVDTLIRLLLDQDPAAIQKLNSDQLQTLINGVHAFGKQWRTACQSQPGSHRRLIRDFPELAATDWFLACFNATCPGASVKTL